MKAFHFKKIVFAVLIIGIIAGCVLSFIVYLYKQSNSAEYQMGITWKVYESKAGGFSFDYPSTWIVSEGTDMLNHSTDEIPSLFACPPEGEMFGFKGATNCIELFSAARLAHPIVNLYTDEVELFNNIRIYFSSENRQHNIGDYKWHLLNTQYVDQGNVYSSASFLGFIDDAQDHMAAAEQGLCAPHKSTECLFVFKHVIDSVEFTKN